MNQTASSLPNAKQSPFYGPSTPGVHRGKRRCQLVLISNPAVNQEGDFLRAAEYIRQYDPKIKTTIINDRRRGMAQLLATLAVPTLAVSLVELARFRPPRGLFLQGRNLSKSEEYSIFEKASFSVPKWQLLRPDESPNLDDYGAYVVTKPDRGMRGALVKIKKKGRVRYKPHAKMPDEHRGRMAASVPSDAAMLAQEFIYTGEWPINYRVTTLFGSVIHSVKTEANHERVPIPGPGAFGELQGDKGVNIVASGRGCIMTLNYDEEVIRFGEAAAAAFPDIPLLGFDIVREVPSGKLHILEANACGYVWHFSSPMGKQFQQENGFRLESQFDGIRKAAYILAAKTIELAQ